jgi:uncharacterized protein YacL
MPEQAASGSVSVQPASTPVSNSRAARNSAGTFWDILGLRVIFVIICAAAGFHFRPFSMPKEYGAIAGFLFALGMVAFEVRLRKVSLRRLIGALTGAIFGILLAYLTALVLAHTTMPESTRSFFSLAIFLVLAYIGLVLGANKGDMLNLQAFGGLFGSERNMKHSFKLLDTSVLIDGRVADIGDALFLDGTILVPQFVLRELQMVADSADPLKRQRGRRGLEVLQRIQKMAHVDVQVASEDFANVPDVDLKLIELARRYDAKIVTNDFNLNKVASVQGIEVMNVNQLANALKPVVLPGETMRVFILREGKEYNQGVAYLDDGTMVVVDGARKMVTKTIDISVTSVHQTTAGKMIFGRFDDRNNGDAARPAARNHADPSAPLPGSVPAPLRAPLSAPVPSTSQPEGSGGDSLPRTLYPET